MVSSFFIVEDHTDFREWFMRCVDGQVRDDFRYDYSEDMATREAVHIVLGEHNKHCVMCSLTEQGADLEIRSVIDDLGEIECSDNVLPVMLNVLGLQKSDTKYVFGDITAESLKARLLIAFALIDPEDAPISLDVSNEQLLSYLDSLYFMAEYAIKMNRDISWIEHPGE